MLGSVVALFENRLLKLVQRQHRRSQVALRPVPVVQHLLLVFDSSCLEHDVKSKVLQVQKVFVVVQAVVVVARVHFEEDVVGELRVGEAGD